MRVGAYLCTFATPSFRQMSTPKPVCPTWRPPLPSACLRPNGGEAARRAAQAGRATKARLAPLAVTHRYNRTHCLWLEQFQIAESVRPRTDPVTRDIVPRRPGSGRSALQCCLVGFLHGAGRLALGRWHGTPMVAVPRPGGAQGFARRFRGRQRPVPPTGQPPGRLAEQVRTAKTMVVRITNASDRTAAARP
jgi:hypothetical protein